MGAHAAAARSANTRNSQPATISKPPPWLPGVPEERANDAAAVAGRCGEACRRLRVGHFQEQPWTLNPLKRKP